MKRFAFRSFFLGLASLLSLYATATPGAKPSGLVSGKLLDGQTKEPIPQAQVIVLRAADNAYVCSVATRPDGSFSMSALPFGQYRLYTTVLGYQQMHPVFRVNAQQPHLALGAVALVPLTAPITKVSLTGTLVNHHVVAQPKVGQASRFVLHNTTPQRHSARRIVRL
jgi:hypothetical protein